MKGDAKNIRRIFSITFLAGIMVLCLYVVPTFAEDAKSSENKAEPTVTETTEIGNIENDVDDPDIANPAVDNPSENAVNSGIAKPKIGTPKLATPDKKGISKVTGTYDYNGGKDPSGNNTMALVPGAERTLYTKEHFEATTNVIPPEGMELDYFEIDGQKVLPGESYVVPDHDFVFKFIWRKALAEDEQKVAAEGQKATPVVVRSYKANDFPVVPVKTGDSLNMFIWAGIVVLATIALAVILVSKKKQRDSK